MMRPPARLRLLLSLLFFPAFALLLGFAWQKWHPDGLWRAAEQESATPTAAEP